MDPEEFEYSHESVRPDDFICWTVAFLDWTRTHTHMNVRVIRGVRKRERESVCEDGWMREGLRKSWQINKKKREQRVHSKIKYEKGFLLCWSGVNFTNVLPAAFTYVSCTHSLFVLTF